MPQVQEEGVADGHQTVMRGIRHMASSASSSRGAGLIQINPVGLVAGDDAAQRVEILELHTGRQQSEITEMTAFSSDC